MYKDIKQWLAALAARWGMEEELERQTPVFAWMDAVGEHLAKLARPLYVEGDTLHLAVASGVVATELRLLSGKLLARLREVAPESRIFRLRFHILAPDSPAERPLKVEPTSEEWRQAEGEISRDLPPQLREKLISIAAWALARDRALLSAGGKRCPRCGVVHQGPGDLCPVCALVAGEDED